jgi:hypothetical protein
LGGHLPKIAKSRRERCEREQTASGLCIDSPIQAFSLESSFKRSEGFSTFNDISTMLLSISTSVGEKEN